MRFATVPRASAFAVVFCLLGSAAALAQVAPSLRPDDGDLSFPGIGRVVLAFLFTAALAVLAVAALRRWMPVFQRVTSTGQRLRIVERAQLSAGTRLHLVEIDRERVLIAENRSGVSLTVLPVLPADEKTPENG